MLPAILLLGGCAFDSHSKSLSGKNPSTVTATAVAPIDLVARDFAGALSQLASLPPSLTTVSMQRSARDDGFTIAMLNALQRAGYGVRWVEHEGSAALFQYRRETRDAAASARRHTYELAVGSIEMRRSYVTDGGQRVRPVTPLYVRGTDASGVVLNDAIFDQPYRRESGDSEQPVVHSERDLQIARINAVPITPSADADNTDAHNNSTSSPLDRQSRSRLTVPSEVSPLNPVVGNAVSGASLPLPLADTPRQKNMFELGASNFSDLFAGRDIVMEQTLIFANDSMRLGDLNKRLLGQMVERFNPDTDIFSVVGCSMGPTQVTGGNAALALGRASRVVEALRIAGVVDNRILDEGCWAGDGSLDDLPRRGVGVTLKRKG